MFAQYPSATPAGTSHNSIFPDTQHLTVRAYLRTYGGLSEKWRFYHQNAVDSTFADGAIAYRNLPGGNWKIIRARIGAGDISSGVEMSVPAPVTDWTDVTYDGETSRAVHPGECFWSDEIIFSLPEGRDLVWEWEICGEGIPMTPDSQTATFTDAGNGFFFREEAPLPDLIGNCRTVMARIAFLGDSITQGCQTRKNHYEMWAGQIACALAPHYASWNLGLGFGCGADFATNGYWTKKGKTADIACIAFGVNDLCSGPYQLGRGVTGDELLKTIETNVQLLQTAGVRVIVFSVPPFDYNPVQLDAWRTVRKTLPALAHRLGADYFDMSAVLDGEPPFGSVCPYGFHPNGEGGRAVCEAFLHTGLIR